MRRAQFNLGGLGLHTSGRSCGDGSGGGVAVSAQAVSLGQNGGGAVRANRSRGLIRHGIDHSSVGSCLAVGQADFLGTNAISPDRLLGRGDAAASDTAIDFQHRGLLSRELHRNSGRLRGVGQTIELTHDALGVAASQLFRSLQNGQRKLKVHAFASCAGLGESFISLLDRLGSSGGRSGTESGETGERKQSRGSGFLDLGVRGKAHRHPLVFIRFARFDLNLDFGQCLWR